MAERCITAEGESEAPRVTVATLYSIAQQHLLLTPPEQGTDLLSLHSCESLPPTQEPICVIAEDRQVRQSVPKPQQCRALWLRPFPPLTCQYRAAQSCIMAEGESEGDGDNALLHQQCLSLTPTTAHRPSIILQLCCCL